MLPQEGVWSIVLVVDAQSDHSGITDYEGQSGSVEVNKEKPSVTNQSQLRSVVYLIFEKYNQSFHCWNKTPITVSVSVMYCSLAMYNLTAPGQTLKQSALSFRAKLCHYCPVNLLCWTYSVCWIKTVSVLHSCLDCSSTDWRDVECFQEHTHAVEDVFRSFT